MSRPLRVTVLISGTGTNLKALIEACQSGRLSAEIIHVISNVGSAAGLKWAAQAGIPTTVLEHGRFPGREKFDRALALLMASGDPDLIVLAGFMRIVGEPVLGPFAGRIINLHPSLLPLYPGLNTYQQALDAGDRHHGSSMHFVTSELDGGPVISQVRIPIYDDDDSGSLRRRLAPEEHRLVVATVELFEQRRVESADNHVFVDGRQLERPMQLNDRGILET